MTDRRTTVAWVSVAIVAIALTVAVRTALKAQAVAPPDESSPKVEPRSPVPPAVPVPPSPIPLERPAAAVLLASPDAGAPPKTLEAAGTDARPASEPVQRIHLRGTPRPSTAAPPDTEIDAGNALDAGDAPTIDREGIRTAIRAVTPLVKDCYDAELQRTQDAAGTIQVKFNIVAKDGKGRIDEASIMEDSTLNGFELQSCVLRELSKASFPMPAGDGQVIVHYPFKFSSQSEQ